MFSELVTILCLLGCGGHTNECWKCSGLSQLAAQSFYQVEGATIVADLKISGHDPSERQVL